MSNTPNIRFKGFSDAWEQRKFEEFAQRQSSTMVSDSDNPCVEYEDVISEQGELNKDIYSKDTEKNGIYFTEDDVLYGKLRPYLHNWLNPDFKGVAVGDWWVLRPINMDKNFLYWFIQTPQYDNAANQSSGTKMPRADWKLVSNTEFYIPGSVDEQAQIAGLFANLNNLITLHQHKYDDTVKLKKDMLKKMFPKNGENVPEIRFKGFSGAWEQRKLSELSDYNNGTGHEEYVVEQGKYELITLKSINSEGELVSSEKFIDEKFETLKQGTLIMMLSEQAKGMLGMTTVIPCNDRYILNQRVAALTLHERIDASFLTKAINNKQAYFEQMGAGTKVQNILKSHVENCIIEVPCYEEQQKIGKYFDNLDNLIILHQRECDEIKIIKNYMLNNMFI